MQCAGVLSLSVLCLSDEDCPEEGVTVLHPGLHEFAFSFNLPQM